MDLESLAIQVARSENLSVLPQVVSAVLKLVDDPETTGRTIEKVIERDAALASKLLKVAGSAYYGLQEVGSINRAVSVLGTNAIRSLVMNIAYQQLVSSRQCSKHFHKEQFWTHSLAVATASKILGKLISPDRAEEMYTAGLLHDVGLLALDRFAPDEFDSALMKAADWQVSLADAEREVFGFDHSQVGGVLAVRWGIRGLIPDAIIYHYNPSAGPEPRLINAVALADKLANRCGFRSGDANPTVEIEPEMIEAVGLPEAQYEALMAVMTQEVAKAEEAFQVRKAA